MEIDAVHDALNKEAGFFVGTESFLDSIGLGEELDKAFSIEFLFVFLYEDFLEVFADDTVEPETTNIRQAKVVFDEDGFNWFGRALNRDLFVLNEGHLKGIGANIEEEDFLGFILCSLGDGIIDGSCGVLIDDGQDVEIGNGGGLEQEISLVGGPEIGQDEDCVFDGGFDKFLRFELDVLDDHGHDLEQGEFSGLFGKTFQDELSEELVFEVFVNVLEEEVLFDSPDKRGVLCEVDEEPGVEETVFRVFGSFGQCV